MLGSHDSGLMERSMVHEAWCAGRGCVVRSSAATAATGPPHHPLRFRHQMGMTASGVRDEPIASTAVTAYAYSDVEQIELHTKDWCSQV